jgi:hypothetical protein
MLDSVAALNLSTVKAASEIHLKAIKQLKAYVQSAGSVRLLTDSLYGSNMNSREVRVDGELTTTFQSTASLKYWENSMSEEVINVVLFKAGKLPASITRAIFNCKDIRLPMANLFKLLHRQFPADHETFYKEVVIPYLNRHNSHLLRIAMSNPHPLIEITQIPFGEYLVHSTDDGEKVLPALTWTKALEKSREFAKKGIRNSCYSMAVERANG